MVFPYVLGLLFLFHFKKKKPTKICWNANQRTVLTRERDHCNPILSFALCINDLHSTHLFFSLQYKLFWICWIWKRTPKSHCDWQVNLMIVVTKWWKKKTKKLNLNGTNVYWVAYSSQRDKLHIIRDIRENETIIGIRRWQFDKIMKIFIFSIWSYCTRHYRYDSIGLLKVKLYQDNSKPSLLMLKE